MKIKITVFTSLVSLPLLVFSTVPTFAEGNETSPQSSIALSIDSITTDNIKLDHSIIVTVKGNFTEARDNQGDKPAPLDMNKLKILVGGYVIKANAVLTAPNEVTFRWDESATAQEDKKTLGAKDLRKKLLIDTDRRGEANVTLRLSYGNQLHEIPKITTIKVSIYNENLVYTCGAVLALCIVLFIWLARNSDIIRDSAPPYPALGTRKPYSLGNLQMALWFFIVIGSFLWLWAITSDIPGISNTALILMGLSVGTGALAVVVDNNKRETADNELGVLIPERDKLTAVVAELVKLAKLKIEAEQRNEVITLTEAAITALQERIAAAPGNENDHNELNKLTLNVAKAKIELKQIYDKIDVLQPANDGTVSGDLTKLGNVNIQISENKAKLAQKEKQIGSAITAQTKPVSEGFLKDILTDMNGISFHRFQMLGWTLVLIAVFLQKVWTTLAIPDIDPMLLTLTGISGATYIGFKIPERQT